MTQQRRLCQDPRPAHPHISHSVSCWAYYWRTLLTGFRREALPHHQRPPPFLQLQLSNRKRPNRTQQEGTGPPCLLIPANSGSCSCGLPTGLSSFLARFFSQPALAAGVEPCTATDLRNKLSRLSNRRQDIFSLLFRKLLPPYQESP